MSLAGRSARIINRTTRYLEPVAELPIFLCPGLLRSTPRPQQRAEHHLLRNNHEFPRRKFHVSIPIQEDTHNAPDSLKTRTLPEQCAGCGALSQTVHKEEPGYFSLNRKSVKEYLGLLPVSRIAKEEALIQKRLEDVDKELAQSLGFNKPAQTNQPLEPPVCDRCHNLKHHQIGASVHHPTIESLQETISESPYKYNHVYHVIDAADFPMSIIRNIHYLLDLTPQRSHNRRSKAGRFYKGRKTEMSFIITRSDLLAPLKTQVDSMMPYLVSVLRDALGRSGRNVRLGNVRCVSAVRGWWTKELKEDIWDRGGGGWMVGKVNVGKSRLFHDVFPKGRRGLPTPEKATRPEMESLKSEASSATTAILEENETEGSNNEELELTETKILDTSSLLPPAQPEVDYPPMPLVSSLPGTTASPIRVPFGNGRGELIDLPGLSRGDLELYVTEQHRPSLVMRSRIRPEQQVIKPGQSLLIGGFIRITPVTEGVIFLAYSFTPIRSHLTSTEKAIGTQTQTRESSVENIALPGIGEKIASAGIFPLKWDVTKRRSGPVTAPDAAGIKVDRLPYRILSTDILIEGCGWVELVAQVRKRPGELTRNNDESVDASSLVDETKQADYELSDPTWPAVEVFTPEGKFIASRRPMNAWLYGEASKPKSSSRQGRPRRSMKGVKKGEKLDKKMASVQY
ncbi:hypothetical protein F5884DRAFT_700589 [Xylogone sp. PMI_703]|nr:hypothetical protein F5884DRAFT_700589 [Xylogone sp. PMI_703]